MSIVKSGLDFKPRLLGWYQSKLFLLVIALLVACLGCYLSLDARLMRCKQLQQEESQLKARLQMNRQELAVMPDYHRQQQQFQAEWLALDAQLVKPEQLAKVLLVISDCIVGNGLQIRLLQPMVTAQVGHYQVVPVNVQIAGPYQAILRLFHDMGHFQHLFKIDDLSISAEANNLLQLAMVIKLYTSDQIINQ